MLRRKEKRMFREMRRAEQAMTKEECLETLKKAKRGVISVIGDDGYPYGTPIDHYYDEEDGKLYFHSGKIGHRIDAMRANDKASYCVYEKTHQDPGTWIWNFNCVHVFGRVEFIEDIDEVETICRKLSHKFTEDEQYIDDEVKLALKATLCYSITIENMTGKKIHET